MFTDRFGGCEQSDQINASFASGSSVQPVRLRPEPLHGGSWVIPGINADVPSILRMHGSLAAKQMASFSLTAHTMGVPLPEGMFINPIDTVNKQWRNYLAANCGLDEPLGLSLYVEFCRDTIKVAVTTASHLNIFRLKPVIEKLNQRQVGLGWLVFGIINSATANGYPIYKIDDMASMASNVWYNGEGSDEAVAELLREYEGYGPEVTLACLKDENLFPWPSDLVKAVDGHEWMLGFWDFDTKTNRPIRRGEKPKTCSLKEARTFLKQPRANQTLKAVVSNALALRAELHRKNSKLIDAKRIIEDVVDSETDYYPVVGASCAVVWDQHEQLFEAVEHSEESDMNSGEMTDVIYTFSADPDQESQVTELIQSMQDFVKRHAAISRVLRYFPKVM